MFFLVFIITLSVTASALNDKDIRNGICRECNAYYKIKGSCDTYIECNEHQATYKSCPYGLRFIHDVVWPQYPCAYPLDTECDSEDVLQKALPDCKYYYGFFASPLASRSDCGKYRMCIDGRAFEMECSIGLAFNPEIGLCDWPELVRVCDPEAFLGVKCPPATYDEHGKTCVVNFGISGRCYYYISCMGGVARLQNCDPGYAYDHTANRCIDATRVYCTEE